MTRREVFADVRGAEDEYHAAVLALDRLQAESAHNVTVLAAADVSLRDVVACARNLERTYVIRVYASFEAALRDYWQSPHGCRRSSEPAAGRLPMADTGLTHDAWLARVPELVTSCCEEWALMPGLAYPPGAAGHVIRVERSDGTPAVLKLIYPHRESEHEVDALALWKGDGAVRLLERSEDGFAILLERCEPGTVLAEEGQEVALDILIGLLPRLWKSAEGFATVEEGVPYLLQDLEQARDQDLKNAALAYLRDLVPTQGERVLVNEDLHGENVLAAEREPWLVIDPKPVAAERELGVAPIVRSFELGHSKRQVLYRLDRLCSDLELERERALGWTVAHTVAWSGGSDYIETDIETVRWLLESG